ncbi:pimeloyl-ACP methyl ester carboxylesterase [Chryseobacterium ginsenosidimutans]|uniref:alpha/beta fold hydrolase n=1 Tax=Chryseobacterium ginsenosidimutans TaxID=687846 RepID=UPI00278879C5|nr:alpha/beta hydrolase [Chryseobacterium ginsenosidimutans]MDQ0593638.1 pimeloyl-ACP methyl ester carboxylesterase [Chryseobacterium ginsenosidimutans]
MTTLKETSVSTPTRYIEANGTTYAYRRFGKKAGVPVIGFQHFTGTLDNWDPTIMDGLAQEREVIIFDNKGVGNSRGETPDNVLKMTEDAIDFIKALGITEFDVLGFSLGGFIAQYLGVRYSEMVRKIIIVGSAPQGAKVLEGFNDLIAKGPHSDPAELFLYIFFTPSENSRAKGKEALKRLYERSEDRDRDAVVGAVSAQAKAITDWEKTSDINLAEITVPVLIIQGSNDEMMDSKTSYELFEQIPNALLSYYPDSAHGSFFQYPDMFVKQANGFLNDF